MKQWCNDLWILVVFGVYFVGLAVLAFAFAAWERIASLGRRRK